MVRLEMAGLKPCATAVVVFGLFAAACERESRPLRTLPVAASRAQTASETPLYAGAAAPPPSMASPFQDNAWGVAEGKRLYSNYNCVGCHANGGGGIGPPLMDDEWIYGWQPGNLFNTIVEGRPNGMPSFRNKIPDYQVWQLVAYIESLSGQLSPFVSSPRTDHMRVHRPEPQLPYLGRRQTGHR